ncbi:adaptin N terminal region-domain-containing protein [Hyaloraphidium curvatum]|nr:adaptin N terminal region-domain-containing protein [Hyaloraphidium curvatum]
MSSRSTPVPRGLTVFIADLRNCRAKEQEEKRVNKELANIRSKFKDGSLSGYQVKKYVSKLLYMYILGYDIDMGHMEAVNLLSSNKYTEKQVGYLGVTLLLNENSDLLRLVINSIRKDLDDNNEVFQCLALHAIANIAGKDMAESLGNDVQRVLVSKSNRTFVKKKAALTLLRLYRKNPDAFAAALKDWSPRIVALLDEPDLGVVTTVTSLITAFAQSAPELFVSCVPKAVDRLRRVVVEHEFTPDYVYYKVPNPWMQVKLLRLLQYYAPPADPTTRSRLNEVLKAIITSSQDASKNPQSSNAQNAVLFEAISLAIADDPESRIVADAANILCRFIASKETNVRYLGLETMSHLAGFSDSGLEIIKTHQDAIILSLKDRDISVRRRALDLLYSMCDQTNAKGIVAELLQYLMVAEYGIREEMVLKLAILAEKWAEDYSWYVDVMLQLVSIAGDHVGDEVWHRVIQIIVNHQELQEYAARTVLESLKSPSCHETTVKVGGYVLGEFGHLIVESPGASPIEQLTSLHSKFGNCSMATRALLLTTYLKFVNLFPEIKQDVVRIFQQYRHVLDLEVQQRASEYLAIASMPTDEVLQSVCDEMPGFPDRESALVSRLEKKIADTEDKRTWVIGGKEANSQRRSLRNRGKQPAVPPLVDAPAVPEKVLPALPPKEQPVAKVNGTSHIEPAVNGRANGGFTDLPAETSAPAVPKRALPELSPTERFFNKLVTSANGVLYEDDNVQFGVKSEYRGHLGRIALFIGNKTQSTLLNLAIDVRSPQELKISVTQPLSQDSIPPVTQYSQTYNVECAGVPSKPPVLVVSYDLAGIPITHSLDLPIVIAKFMEAIDLTPTDFFNRWKQIGGPPREVQTIFPSSGPIDLGKVKAAMAGVKLGICHAADPNPNNVVAAGILNTVSTGKVGCLVRLEPNAERQIFRLTIRCTNDAVAEALKKFLSQTFSQ